MKYLLSISLALIFSVSLFLKWIFQPSFNLSEEKLINIKSKEVTIFRDTWGVPHIYGKTDPDAAFGLAYAHCEDDFSTIQDVIIMLRQKSGLLKGQEGAMTDFLMEWLKIYETVEKNYSTHLSTEVHQLMEGYCDGINLYAHEHNEEIKLNLFPVEPQDIVAGFVFRTPMFFGLDRELESLFKLTEKPEIAKDIKRHKRESPIGSNGFAVSPKRSENGETMLVINSHQPWDGPTAWYEAHVHSDDGWNMSGGLFPGSPVIFVGHNDSLGWVHTVNEPDLIDTYILDIHPENPDLYRFDNEWLKLEKKTIPIKLKILGPFSWTIHRDVLWSVYGPVLRFDHGTYAIRYSGMGEIRQIEQWYRMNKSTNFNEWIDAMKIHGIPSLNSVYADYSGNIFYVYNGKYPNRSSGYDWQGYLPGWTSETLWKTTTNFDSTPQLLNPESGVLFSTNQSPYHVTDGTDNILQSDFPVEWGVETHMNNRSHRAKELFSNEPDISFEELKNIKFDKCYSKHSSIAQHTEDIIKAIRNSASELADAADVLSDWDFCTDMENEKATLAVIATKPFLQSQYIKMNNDTLLQSTRIAVDYLMKNHGSLKVPFGNVQRLVRGKKDLPIGGGPDILRAVYSHYDDNGKIVGHSGDGLFMFVKWDKTGNVFSESIHQYGSAVTREKSVHFDDQTQLFVQENVKPVWRDKNKLLNHLKAKYSPGKYLSDF
ncbi:MAG: acylase [Candidatus Marinimicrobia bacterium]|nr:acylase [Candidatus Neomarinimicrobiota bacterium]